MQLWNIKAFIPAPVNLTAIPNTPSARSSACIQRLQHVDDKVKHRQPRDVYLSMVRQDSINTHATVTAS